MTYATEFPDFPASDLPPIPVGFEDTSSHNNVCPSFTWNTGDDKTSLLLWVDYSDNALREFPRDYPRFLLQVGVDTEKQQTTLYSGDDRDACVAAIEAAMPKAEMSTEWLDKAHLAYYRLRDAMKNLSRAMDAGVGFTPNVIVGPNPLDPQQVIDHVREIEQHAAVLHNALSIAPWAPIATSKTTR